MTVLVSQTVVLPSSGTYGENYQVIADGGTNRLKKILFQNLGGGTVYLSYAPRSTGGANPFYFSIPLQDGIPFILYDVDLYYWGLSGAAGQSVYAFISDQETPVSQGLTVTSFPGSSNNTGVPIGQNVSILRGWYWGYTDSSSGYFNQLDLELIETGASGNKVVEYLAVQCATGANIWAINPLIQMPSGFTGEGICAEFDLNLTSSTATFGWGILINGVSTTSPAAAIVIQHNGVNYLTGIQIDNSNYGVNIAGPASQALIVTNASSSATYFALSPAGAVGTLNGVASEGPYGVPLVVASAVPSWTTSSVNVVSYTDATGVDFTIDVSAYLFVGTYSSGDIGVQVVYTNASDDTQYTRVFLFTNGEASGYTPNPVVGATGVFFGMPMNGIRCKASTSVTVTVNPPGSGASGSCSAQIKVCG